MVQKEAELKDKEELVDLLSREKTPVQLHNGKVVKVGFLMPDAQDKIDYLIVKYEAFKKRLERKKGGEELTDEAELEGNRYTRRFYAQCAAAILLNSYWSLTLFWWLKWRYLYHFGGWNGADYLAVITEAKKKATEGEYQLAMVFLMDMTTTWTTMTKKEAEEYRQELQLAREAQSLRSSQA